MVELNLDESPAPEIVLFNFMAIRAVLNPARDLFLISPAKLNVAFQSSVEEDLVPVVEGFYNKIETPRSNFGPVRIIQW